MSSTKTIELFNDLHFFLKKKRKGPFWSSFHWFVGYKKVLVWANEIDFVGSV